MKPSVVKLETFVSESPADRIARISAEAAARAHAAGLAEGRAAQASAETAALIEALRDLAAELAREEPRRDGMRREALAALTPILTAILDAMAPAGQSARLEQCLIEEMSRLVRQAPPVQARVACSAQMRPLVERCAEAAGLTAIEIVEQPLGRALHLSLQGGHIEFSQDAAAEAIRALIREIQED